MGVLLPGGRKRRSQRRTGRRFDRSMEGIITKKVFTPKNGDREDDG